MFMQRGDASSVTALFLQGQAVRAIVVGGFAVGVLDLAYAILVYTPKRPILVPQACWASEPMMVALEQ
jgi:hypothetical protein